PQSTPFPYTTLFRSWGDNGDLLGFAMKACETTGARTPRILDPSYGPVITSYVRVPDASDGGTGRGFYVEDAGYPDFINWMLLLEDRKSTRLNSSHLV